MSLSVAIMGSGNMAYQLLSAFDKTDVNLAGLISRDLSQGMKTLEATKAKCELVGGLHLGELEADIIILAVPESAIPKVLKFYEFNENHVVVHTSGAEPMDSLHLERVGVFYPLQTLTWGETIDFSSVPILVEGSNISAEEMLIELGETISRNVRVMPSEERLKIHLAAVLVSNFPNHLFRRAEQILSTTDQDIAFLYPVIEEMIRKFKTLGPEKAQTGPARRNDEPTIEKHLSAIDDPELKEIYNAISEDIKRHYE